MTNGAVAIILDAENPYERSHFFPVLSSLMELTVIYLVDSGQAVKGNKEENGRKKYHSLRVLVIRIFVPQLQSILLFPDAATRDGFRGVS